MGILEAFLFYRLSRPPPPPSPAPCTMESPVQTGSPSGLVTDIGLGQLGCIWRQRGCLGTYLQSSLVSTLFLPPAKLDAAPKNLENWIREANDSVSPIALESVCRTAQNRASAVQGQGVSWG